MNNITCLSIFEAIFLKLIKKRMALTCFIEITSILAHAKSRLIIIEEASSILLLDFKNEIFQRAHAFKKILAAI